ncbi:hypothetical protein [Streptomyces sp. NRRL F-2664]|uniref:hypothetical protein n=1 Tax=Streptomyces sp. NRRL F-2664 TaxID=1463842 RepID=UPI00131CA2D5|nr:hypothetical protein [Streptomyces sp. NRRL F-2664]
MSSAGDMACADDMVVASYEVVPVTWGVDDGHPVSLVVVTVGMSGCHTRSHRDDDRYRCRAYMMPVKHCLLSSSKWTSSAEYRENFDGVSLRCRVKSTARHHKKG